MTAIVTIGIELSARTAGRPARRRDRDARGVRDRRARQGLRHRRSDRGASLARRGSTPSRSRPPRCCIDGVLLGDIHLLGLGQRRQPSTRRRRTPAEAPGRSAVISDPDPGRDLHRRLAVAALAYAGTEFLRKNRRGRAWRLGADVFGTPLDKIVIIAVLTSGRASTQTTILPTARTSLSMARPQGDPDHVRARPPALPDAPHLDDRHGRPVGRLVRRPDAFARTSSSTRSRRSA